jgi:hypothetical protein
VITKRRQSGASKVDMANKLQMSNFLMLPSNQDTLELLKPVEQTSFSLKKLKEITYLAQPNKTKSVKNTVLPVGRKELASNVSKKSGRMTQFTSKTTTAAGSNLNFYAP